MNFLKRLKRLWSGLWHNILNYQEEKNPKALTAGILQEYQDKILKSNEMIINLRYKERRLDQQVQRKRDEVSNYEGFVKDMLTRQEEKNPLPYLKNLKSKKSELEQMAIQYKDIKNGLEEAFKLKEKLKSQFEESKTKFHSMADKIEILQVKKLVTKQLNNLSENLGTIDNSNSLLKLDKIAFKLESEIEELNSYINNAPDRAYNEYQKRIELKENTDELQKLKVELGLIKTLPEPKNVNHFVLT